MITVVEKNKSTHKDTQLHVSMPVSLRIYLSFIQAFFKLQTHVVHVLPRYFLKCRAGL